MPQFAVIYRKKHRANSKIEWFYTFNAAENRVKELEKDKNIVELALTARL